MKTWEIRNTNTDALVESKFIEDSWSPSEHIRAKYNAKNLELYEKVVEATPAIELDENVEQSITLDKVNFLAVYGWEIVAASEEEVKQRTFGAAITAGYHVTPEDFHLGLDTTDINNFTSFMALVNELITLGAYNGSTEVTIHSVEGPQTMTVTRFKQIILQYGGYYKSVFDAAR